MIKELPDDWITVDIPKNESESVWGQWLLFNNVSYVVGFGKIAIRDPEVALLFRLVFGT